LPRSIWFWEAALGGLAPSGTWGCLAGSVFGGLPWGGRPPDGSGGFLGESGLREQPWETGRPLALGVSWLDRSGASRPGRPVGLSHFGLPRWIWFREPALGRPGAAWIRDLPLSMSAGDCPRGACGPLALGIAPLDRSGRSSPEAACRPGGHGVAWVDQGGASNPGEAWSRLALGVARLDLCGAVGGGEVCRRSSHGVAELDEV
jgi:hypothetical protein